MDVLRTPACRNDWLGGCVPKHVISCALVIRLLRQYVCVHVVSGGG